MTPKLQGEAFLGRRLREYSKVQPEIRQLKRLVLKIRGCQLVVPLALDGNVAGLIDSGFVMQGPVVLKRMAANSCHLNASRLWAEHKHGVVAIGSGYALSADGLWRQHSWGCCGKASLRPLS